MPKRYRQLQVKDLHKVDLYVVGFEPMTLRREGIEPITEPPRYDT